MALTRKKALAVVGGLSKPSKMPGHGWSISAHECKRGSILRGISGSTCSTCYACKGRYSFDQTQAALYRRSQQFHDPAWVASMSFLLANMDYFRWFDSGDLQSVEMLDKIAQVARNTPKCKHWLPTRERGIVRKAIVDHGIEIPRNLVIRISADMIDGDPIIPVKHKQVRGSTVSIDRAVPKREQCPVAHNKAIQTCDQAKCRKCWDPKFAIVDYRKH